MKNLILSIFKIATLIVAIFLICYINTIVSSSIGLLVIIVILFTSFNNKQKHNNY